MKNSSQNIIIKNMVCPRCISAVEGIFETAGIPVAEVSLGKVRVSKPITKSQRQTLKAALAQKGFELLNDKNAQLITKIKATIIEEIHYQKEPAPINFSTLLSEKLNYDYAYLSRLFSAVEGRTIEKFILSQKIEKVKELLTYDELTLSEIAFQMNYSSTAHLSNQFKKITGMSPSVFKRNHKNARRSLDDV